MTTDPHTALTWGYEYMPYLMSEYADPSRENEIPNYRIFPWDDPENYIAETNEHLPGDLQETYALLITAAPDLRDALQFFLDIMHDYQSSLRKGYVKLAIEKARHALTEAKGGAI